jgi:hypothetical protein
MSETSCMHCGRSPRQDETANTWGTRSMWPICPECQATFAGLPDPAAPPVSCPACGMTVAMNVGGFATCLACDHTWLSGGA